MIETARLFFCRPTNENILKIENLWRNECVRRYLGGIISDDNIKKKVANLKNHWSLHKFGQMIICHKSTKEIIGLCGINFSKDGNELSYMLYPQYWGNGFAFEATKANITHGFDTLKMKEIISITQKANIKSCHLLNKIGMEHIKDFERFNSTQSLFKIKK